LSNKIAKIEKLTRCVVGLLHNEINVGIMLSELANNAYATATLAANVRFRIHKIYELPVEARQVPPNVQGNVYGCGILIS
jgi:hypothetical protein